MSKEKYPGQASKTLMNRRGVLGAAMGLFMAEEGLGIERIAPEPRVLVEGDRIKPAIDPEAILERAYCLGHKYEKEHGGCARCTVAALQDALPMVAVDEGLFRASSCLDGGATPVAVQNCGGFTGAGMVIGFLCGSRRDTSFQGSSALAHRLLHQVYHQFAKHYGTVLCRDVRKGAEGDCPEVVGRAARWTAEALLVEFAGMKPTNDPEAPLR